MVEEHEDKPQEQQGAVEICPVCHKRVRPLKSGSLTGWVFASSVCTCNTPAAAGTISASSQKSQTKLQSLTLPTLGDRYEVIDLLGIGGMGSVYRIVDRENGKTLAAKVLRADLAHDPSRRAAFQKEIEAATQLDHRNLVAVLSYGTTAEDLPYAVMEYVDGKGLNQVLASELSIDSARAIDLFLQIAEGVTYAHSLGIIHLDLKPSNVIVTTGDGGEMAKVVDFGIARIVTADSEHLAEAEEIVGSLPYMSPEQCRGTQVDFRSDIYSMGCLMYEVIAGKAAFLGDNPVKTIMKHLSERPRDLTGTLTRFEAPPELIKLILHCVEARPEDRYQLMDELVKDLASIKDGKQALVVTQQLSDRQAQAKFVVKPWQKWTLAVVFISAAALYFSMMSPYDSITQFIVLLNVIVLLAALTIWGWACLTLLARRRRLVLRLSQKDLSLPADKWLLLGMDALLAAIVLLLPGILSSSFMATIFHRLLRTVTPLAGMKMLAASLHSSLALIMVMVVVLYAGWFIRRRAGSVSVQSRSGW